MVMHSKRQVTRRGLDQLLVAVQLAPLFPAALLLLALLLVLEDDKPAELVRMLVRS